jgi:hypothetical protein
VFDMRILNGATPLCLRTLAVAGALIAGMAAAPAPIPCAGTG